MRKLLRFFGLVKRSDIIELLELVDNIRIYSVTEFYHKQNLLRIGREIRKLLK